LLWKAGMQKVSLGLFGLVPSPIPGEDPIPMKPSIPHLTTTSTCGTGNGFSASSSSAAMAPNLVQSSLGENGRREPLRRAPSPLQAASPLKRADEYPTSSVWNGVPHEHYGIPFRAGHCRMRDGGRPSLSGAMQSNFDYSQEARFICREPAPRGRGREPVPVSGAVVETRWVIPHDCSAAENGNVSAGDFIKDGVIQRFPEMTARSGNCGSSRSSSAPPCVETIPQKESVPARVTTMTSATTTGTTSQATLECFGLRRDSL